MASSADGRKRKSLSLRKKLEILDEVRDNPQESRTNIAKRLDIPYSTLTTIIGHEAEIRSNASKAGPTGEKRMRNQEGKFADLDEALMKWFKKKRAANIPVSGPMLQQRALIFAEKLNITSDFKASSGWLHRLKNRCGINGRSVCGEANSVDEATVEHWKNIVLPRILTNYNHRDIYNTNETGLFFNLPFKTLAKTGYTCHEGKRSKERFTVLLTTNADGSDKLRPLVIGKSQKPRCFEGIKSLPVEYAANKKGSITADLFKIHLDKLNSRMRREKRNILLLLENCAVHSTTLRFSNIELAFFPANCTSRLQPLDLGIVACVKAKYRKILLQQTVAKLDLGEEKPKVNILQAMQLVNIAWNQVPSDTIAKCFRKAGVVTHTDSDARSDTDEDIDTMNEPGNWDRVREGVRTEDFVLYNEGLAACAGKKDDDIKAEVLSPNLDEDSSSGETDDLADQEPIKLSQALFALEVTKRYIMSKVVSEGDMRIVSEYERLIYECSVTQKSTQV